jgi:hypothetical protein
VAACFHNRPRSLFVNMRIVRAALGTSSACRSSSSLQRHGDLRLCLYRNTFHLDSPVRRTLPCEQCARKPSPIVTRTHSHHKASPHPGWSCPLGFMPPCAGDACGFHQILTAMVVYDSVSVRVGLRTVMDSWSVIGAEGGGRAVVHSYQARSIAGLSSILCHPAHESIACRHHLLS